MVVATDFQGSAVRCCMPWLPSRTFVSVFMHFSGAIAVLLRRYYSDNVTT